MFAHANSIDAQWSGLAEGLASKAVAIHSATAEPGQAVAMSHAKGPAISAAIIHNSSPSRLFIREQLTQFCRDLQIPLSEVVEQPPLSACRSMAWTRLYLAARECMKILCAAAYLRASRHRPWRVILVVVVKELRHVLHLLCRASRDDVRTAYRRSQIEVILSTKHLAAWTRAQEKQSDWALVFEDDAEVAPDSVARWMRLVDHGFVDGFLGRTAYVDLAGGFAPALVLPLQHACFASNDVWVFNGLITNTTCSYLASRSTMAAWVETLKRWPVFLQLPADHMINFISLPVVSGLRDVFSIHLREPLFCHGSFRGSTPSLISQPSA